MTATQPYFKRFEDRVPPEPMMVGTGIQLAFQFFATLAMLFGAWYIAWRWTASINHEALWFSIPLLLAETFAFFGLILFFYNIWAPTDPGVQPPPTRLGETDPNAFEPERPINIDIFITTYNEDEELVRLSIRDAMAVRAAGGCRVQVHVCDDGRRASMKAVTLEEGASYIDRSDNIGFKAGNLRNAMDRTHGDFIVICDADTRLFPTYLERTLGYFRDPDMAFVQTPQWFYDLPEGERLPVAWGRRGGVVGRWAARAVEALFGKIQSGADPFVNDPALFYDVILRRRNRVNAVFCCGAASIHRREAVMYSALRVYAKSIEQSGRRPILSWLVGREKDSEEDRRHRAAQELELTPYKFHVSEDIYTSIVLQQDRSRRWKSLLHPWTESRMLSPQDLLTWTIQRFKYAGGSLDIFLRDNPIMKRGLSFGQRMMYLSTFWSYLAGAWNLIFLTWPMIYFLTGTPPVAAYTADFFLRLVPFMILLELAMMFGYWGYSGYRSKTSFLASFPISINALWNVILGKPIKFHVTPKVRQEGRFLRLVWPQLAIMAGSMATLLYAIWRLADGDDRYTVEGVIANGLWAIHNTAAMNLMVKAAQFNPDADEGVEGASA